MRRLPIYCAFWPLSRPLCAPTTSSQGSFPYLAFTRLRNCSHIRLNKGAAEKWVLTRAAKPLLLFYTLLTHLQFLEDGLPLKPTPACPASKALWLQSRVLEQPGIQSKVLRNWHLWCSCQ